MPPLRPRRLTPFKVQEPPLGAAKPRAMHAFALAAALATAKTAAIDRIVRYVMGDQHVLGLSLAVTVGDRTVYAHGYGFADRRRTTRARPDTVFAVASLEKPFIAATVLRLAERRRLSLDDTVAKYVPWYEAARNVTIAQLLSHTSGIPDYAELSTFRRGERAVVSPDDLLHRVATLPLLFDPGTQWHYSNTDYVLLGVIVQDVTGVPLASWLHRDLLDPLHLVKTKTWQPNLPEPDRAAGSAPAGSPTLAFAAADLESTAPDLAQWSRDLLSGRVVDRRDLDRMFDGMGFFASRFDRLQTAWHSGYIEGYSSYMILVPARRLAVVLLCNEDRVDLGPLGLSIVQDVLARP
jgi:D-alanyl-D-alanine carboxypeptidase